MANSLNNLADLYQAMGQYDKAEPLYQRSLKIREAKLGKDHPDVAASLNNLASLYKDMGQYEKAEPLLQRSLQIREDNLGKDHPDVAQSLDNLGTLYLIMDQDAKAEPLLQRSLKIREDRLGKDHPYVASSQNNLAHLYLVMGQYDKAEPLFQRSLRIWEDKTRQGPPRCGQQSHSNLAVLYAYMGRWQEAAEAADRARRIIRRHVAPHSPHALREGAARLPGAYRRQGFPRLRSRWPCGRRGDAATAALSAGWVLNGKAVAHEALAQRALAALDAKDPAAAELSQQLLGVRQPAGRPDSGRGPAGPGGPAPQGNWTSWPRRRTTCPARLAKAGGHSARAEPWVELAEVRKALPADAVLIEISRFQVAQLRGQGRGQEVARATATPPG